MTLAILSSKIAAASSAPKVDGRCYNVRSQKKTKWEVYNLNRLQKKRSSRLKRHGSARGICSKDEMKEYEQIYRAEREAMIHQRKLRDAASAAESATRPDSKTD